MTSAQFAALTTHFLDHVGPIKGLSTQINKGLTPISPMGESGVLSEGFGQMNAHTVIAQASTASTSTPPKDPKIVKVIKPAGGQAVTVELGYDQGAKLDLSGVASEKITLVHIGENLIILFDNNATVTVHPFFDSMGVPLANLTV